MTRLRWTVAPLACLLAASAVPSVVPAYADTCPTVATLSLPPSGSSVSVSGSLTYGNITPCGPGMFSAAANCPPGPPITLPGEYCGDSVSLGATVTCSASTSIGSTTTGLMVGVDVDGDGYLGIQDPFPVLGPLGSGPTGGVVAFEFTAAGSGRLIAYPVSAVFGGSASDTTTVLCV